jgi:phosphate:Na+ symporter
MNGIFNSIILLVSGLVFFLYGMNVLSSGLERLAGGKLEGALKKMTSNVYKAFALGAGITIAIQSSSAMTVMLVGLVNSGIMKFGQTIGVIMGSNVGTTLTAWILSATGIESDLFFVKLLKPDNFAPLLALVGIAMIMMSKSKKKRDIGEIFVGFCILMIGMSLMGDSVAPLSENPEKFEKFLSIFEIPFAGPIIGVLVGAVFTGIIQSSAASVGILQALSLTGQLTYGIAIPIIMGQNIGTCVTALLSSIGVNKNARRVSVIHVSFNLIGTLISLILFYGAHAIFHFAFVANPINAVAIAAVHTIFNVFTTALLLPFGKMLERIANIVVRDDESESEEYAFLDERLFKTPSVAISECRNLTEEMSDIAEKTIHSAISLTKEYSEECKESIFSMEDKLDNFEDKLGTALVKLSGFDNSAADSKKISMMLHTIGDFERLGDHAVNLVKAATEIHDKKIVFSDEANRELSVLSGAIGEIMQITVSSYKENDLALASRVEPLEQVIDGLIATIKSNHINRLQKGNCTIELGFVLSDLLTNYERISDHCSNIAVAMIELSHSSFDTHEYLNVLKSASTGEFKEEYDKFKLKYRIK